MNQVRLNEEIANEEGDKPPSQIKSLIVSNIAETYYKTYKKTNPQEAETRINYDFLEAERAAFYTCENKAVITSVPVNAEFLHDSKKLLGLDCLINLYPENPTHRISADILKDKILFSEVVAIIKTNPGLELIPYYATEEFFDLVSTLRQKGLKFTTPETVSAKNRFIRDHYNCKVGFRKLWDKTMDEHSFVKIPKGFVVDDLAEGIDAAWWFYQHKTDFVVKYNRGTSGFGVVFYHCRDLPAEEKEFRKYLRNHHAERMWFEESFVVEEWIDIDQEFYGGSPSIEFKINGEVRHQYTCVQRLGEKSYFEGIMMAKEVEEKSDIDLKRAVENCLEYGESLSELGYRGLFDIDLVIDKKHNVFAVEANLRRTGGTHIHETAQHFFGKNFEQKTVVVSKDNLPVSPAIQTYHDFKAKAQSLYFSKEKGEGIIPTIVSFLKIGKVGYIAFGKTLKRVEEIEKELSAAVSEKSP